MSEIFDNELPEIKQFCASLAQLHWDSVSPSGEFSFFVTTYNRNISQDVRYTDTWEECFVNGTRRDFELEKEAHGPNEELEALMGPLFEKVIPRLLRHWKQTGKCWSPVSFMVTSGMGMVNTEAWHAPTRCQGLIVSWKLCSIQQHNSRTLNGLRRCWLLWSQWMWVSQQVWGSKVKYLK